MNSIYIFDYASMEPEIEPLHTHEEIDPVTGDPITYVDHIYKKGDLFWFPYSIGDKSGKAYCYVKKEIEPNVKLTPNEFYPYVINPSRSYTEFYGSLMNPQVEGVPTVFYPYTWKDTPKKMKLVGILSEYISLIWIDKYNEPGTFQLDFVADEDTVALLKTGRYISIGDSEEWMIIENVKISFASSNGYYKGVATGRSLSSILDRRVTIPADDFTSDAVYNREGGMYSAIESLMYHFFINPDAFQPGVETGSNTNFPNRRMPEIIFTPVDKETADERHEKIFTGRVKKLCRDDTVLEIMQNFCKGFGIGFRIIPKKVYETQGVKLAFELYNGVDKEKKLRFSESLENINSIDFTEDKSNEKTVAFCKKEQNISQTYVDFSSLVEESEPSSTWIGQVYANIKNFFTNLIKDQLFTSVGMFTFALCARVCTDEYTITNGGQATVKDYIYGPDQIEGQAERTYSDEVIKTAVEDPNLTPQECDLIRKCGFVLLSANPSNHSYGYRVKFKAADATSGASGYFDVEFRSRNGNDDGWFDTYYYDGTQYTFEEDACAHSKDEYLVNNKSYWKRFCMSTSHGWLTSNRLSEAKNIAAEVPRTSDSGFFSNIKSKIADIFSNFIQSQGYSYITKVLYGYYDSGAVGLDRKEIVVNEEKTNEEFSSADQAMWLQQTKEVDFSKTDTETDEDIVKRLNLSAKHNISEYVPKKEMNVDVNTSLLSYKKDYDLGDVCSAYDSFGHKQRIIVSEVTITDDSNGYSVIPAFEKYEIIPAYYKRLTSITVGGMLTNILGNRYNGSITKTSETKEILYPSYPGTMTFRIPVKLTEIHFHGDFNEEDPEKIKTTTGKDTDKVFCLFSVGCDEYYYIDSNGDHALNPKLGGKFLGVPSSYSFFRYFSHYSGQQNGRYYEDYSENAKQETIWGEPHNNNTVSYDKYSGKTPKTFSFEVPSRTDAGTQADDKFADAIKYDDVVNWMGAEVAKQLNVIPFSSDPYPYFCIGAEYTVDSSKNVSERVDITSVYHRTGATGTSELDHNGVIVTGIEAYEYDGYIECKFNRKVYNFLKKDIRYWLKEYSFHVDMESKSLEHELKPVSLAEVDSSQEEKYQYGFYDLVQKEFINVAYGGNTKAAYYDHGGEYVENSEQSI